MSFYLSQDSRSSDLSIRINCSKFKYQVNYVTLILRRFAVSLLVVVALPVVLGPVVVTLDLGGAVGPLHQLGLRLGVGGQVGGGEAVAVARVDVCAALQEQDSAVCVALIGSLGENRFSKKLEKIGYKL